MEIKDYSIVYFDHIAEFKALYTTELLLRVGMVHALQMREYRNLLLFRYKNIFVQRKRMKIFYTNIILQQKLFCVGWLLLHTSTFPIAAVRISLTW